MLFQFNVELKLVAPGDADIGPVTAGPRRFKTTDVLMRTHATEVSRHVCGSLYVASGSSLANSGSVIPCPCGADAHSGHENIPEVPFAQQDPVAGELTPGVARRGCWRGAMHPLE